MSANEDTVLSQYVPGFRANLNLAPQQTMTRLMTAVDADLAYDTPGQMFNADDVLTSDPEAVSSRVPDTPDKFVAMTRSVGFFLPFEDAAWIDNIDKARELQDPTNKIMMALMAGRWRHVDATILAAALGNRYQYNGAIQSGAPTAVSLPAAQVIAANDISFAHDAEVVPSDGSQYGMSIGKLIKANFLLDQSELEGERHLALSAQQRADLLRTTPATSRYYSEVQALVAGTVDSFLGFTIHRVAKGLFQTSTGHDGNQSIRRTCAWVKDAIVYRGRSITDAQIWLRKDKSNTPQAFYKLEDGATRRYDSAVVEIDCYEGAAY